MMIVFLDIQGIVQVEWVPESRTVNQVYYKEVLTNLCERVRRRPEMWRNGSWVLHQDNAPAYNTLSVKTFWIKHKITVLEHPPYSPYLAPCGFFPPKIKSALKGTRFESADAVKAKSTESRISFQKTTCSIASNSVRFAWSGVGIGEGSTLRVTTFLLCNCLNEKCSNISPVIL